MLIVVWLLSWLVAGYITAMLDKRYFLGSCIHSYCNAYVVIVLVFWPVFLTGVLGASAIISVEKIHDWLRKGSKWVI